MSATASVLRSKITRNVLVVLVILAVTIFGFSVFRYFADKNNFKKAIRHICRQIVEQPLVSLRKSSTVRG